MNPMVAASFQFAEQLYFIEVVIAIAVGQSIKSAGNLVLIIVNADIQRIVVPKHPIDRTNIGWHFFNVLLRDRLARRRRRDAVQAAILIADQ